MSDFFTAAKVAIATGTTMFASTSVNVEDGRVSVAVAVTCTVFICGICWWLASRFQSISDSQNEMKASQAEMKARLAKIETELTARNKADDRQQSESENV